MAFTLASLDQEWEEIVDGAMVADSFRNAMLPPLRNIIRARDSDSQGQLKEATSAVLNTFTMVLRGLYATSVCMEPRKEEWGPILDPVMDLSRAAGRGLHPGCPCYNARKAGEATVMLAVVIAQPDPAASAFSIAEDAESFAVAARESGNHFEQAWAAALQGSTAAFCAWFATNTRGGLCWTNSPANFWNTFCVCVGPNQEPSLYFMANPLGPHIPPGAGVLAERRSSVRMSGFRATKLPGDGRRTLISSPSLESQQRPRQLPLAAAKPAAATPVFELQGGRRWHVEHQIGQANLQLAGVAMGHTVYIAHCKETTVTVPAKVTNVTIDNCTRVNVIASDVMSVVEVINCSRCAFQTSGQVGSIAIDKSTGVALYLSEGAKDAEITTSKSSEVNINIPNPNDAEDTIELAIPEQFTSRVSGRALDTAPSSLYG